MLPPSCSFCFPVNHMTPDQQRELGRMEREVTGAGGSPRQSLMRE